MTQTKTVKFERNFNQIGPKLKQKLNNIYIDPQSYVKSYRKFKFFLENDQNKTEHRIFITIEPICTKSY